MNSLQLQGAACSLSSVFAAAASRLKSTAAGSVRSSTFIGRITAEGGGARSRATTSGSETAAARANHAGATNSKPHAIDDPGDAAADIIKMAMIDVDNWLENSDLKSRMIMQVHDELVFEVAADEVDPVREQVCRLMSEAAELAIPLLVEAGVGNNWDEAH